MQLRLATILATVLLLGCAPEAAVPIDDAVATDLADDASAADSLESTDTVVADAASPATIVAFPATVEFHATTPGATLQATVTLSNPGGVAVSIAHVQLKPLGDVTLTVTPNSEFTLQPGQQRLLHLELDDAPAVQDLDLGTLTLVYQDPDLPPKVIALHLAKGAPALQVLVDNAVCPLPANCTADFGAIEKSALAAKPKTVTLRNLGTGTLTVESTEILGNYDFSATTSALPATLLPGASLEVKITFQTNKLDLGQMTADLHVYTNDPVSPNYVLHLQVNLLPTEHCQVVLSPQPLDFGAVALGTVKVLKMHAANVGSHPCKFEAASLVYCNSAKSCTSAGTQAFSVGPIATKLFNLQPNESGDILVQYQPEAKSSAASGDFALLAVKVQDVVTLKEAYSPDVDPTNLTTIGSAAANLSGTGDFTQVLVTSGVEFPPTATNCSAAPQTFNLSNTGTLPVQVTAVTLENCDAGVQVTTDPVVPADGLTLTSGAVLKVTATWTPQNSGLLKCTVVVNPPTVGQCQTASGLLPIECATLAECPKPSIACALTPLKIQLTGQALSPFQSETFLLPASQKDVLFVVDRSTGMGAFQTAVAQAAQAFVGAIPANVSVHIGAIVADLADGIQKAGRLQVVDGQTFLTSQSPNLVKSLQALLNQGEGIASPPESLALVQMALTPPLTNAAYFDCQTDADCKPEETCFVLPMELTKSCGGPNRGFLRPNAQLHVVVLSNSDDQSPGQLAAYVKAFLALQNTYFFPEFHAIANPDPQNACLTALGPAAPTPRYGELIAQSNGSYVTLCSADYTAGLTALTSDLFPPLIPSIHLNYSPDPATISVEVAGVPCKGWTYDVGSNSIQLAGACPGTQAVVTYNLLCN